MNPWPLLRGEKADGERGLQLVEREYADQPNPSASHVMRLGVALLWMGHYGDAWQHFRSVIEADPWSGDNDSGMAGVAKWCLDKPDEAVLEWSAGLRAKYARCSGLGVRMPLLLFFAAVLKPDVFKAEKALALIQKKTGDRRISNWPGPIAKLVTGEISQSDFHSSCIGKDQRHTDDRVWLATFYESVIAYQQGQRAEYGRSMRKLADTDQPEWQDQNSFLTRIWSEEFFLARYEATAERP
jgi:hypothetical protein